LKPYSNYAFETAVFNIFERGDKKQLLWTERESQHLGYPALKFVTAHVILLS
jgi:hypothetical protein